MLNSTDFIPNIRYEDIIEKYKEAIEEYLEVARNSGVVLLVENLSRPYLTDLVKIIKEINDKHLGLTFDVGHAYSLIRTTKYDSIENF